MTEREQILARLREFVTENFLYMRPDFVLGDGDSLLGRGIVDSMGVMEMVQFLEDEFGVTVEDTDITEEQIGTLGAIASYVVARRAARTQVA